ncbi:hypothetical protein [Microbulbifer variabilis]|uniref:Uncharacterized protein n=1 Tax=Microbulbifer variabilis TaxID=266805 RepID=A0ABY4VDI8_9GAMM|nr:hypothetical protein [Microbulbifer variabilis]USD22342.1 hypothetical protein MJO52_04210 [Microbulbifer variabilis]
MVHHNKHFAPLITFLSLIPLVYFIPDSLALILPDHKLLQVITAVAIIVPIISYLILPLAFYSVRHIYGENVER